ncbi:hypothetical protein [Rhizobium sp. PAMB 3182]
MGSWAGSRSREFGVYPVELHFSLDSHVGPSWVVPALFNRSGWLSVAEVEMETEFDRTRAVIAACVNDEGEVLGKWVVEALFSMQSSLPQEVFIEPPNDLADALDALYWDFLGRCDIAHLKVLEEEERRINSTITRLEMRRQEVYEKVEMFLSSLYARRRRERGNAELCTQIDAKIEEVEAKQAETEIWHRGRLQELHAELATFENQVLDALQNHGSLRPLYTVYWQTRHSKIRTLAYTGFEMRYGLPAPRERIIDVASIGIDSKVQRKLRNARKRQEFDDYYAELEKKAQEQAMQGQSLHQIAVALNSPKSTTLKSHAALLDALSQVDIQPVRARPGKTAEIAELSRRWQALYGSVDGVTKPSEVKTKVVKPKASPIPKVEASAAGTDPKLPSPTSQLADDVSTLLTLEDVGPTELSSTPLERGHVDEDLLLEEVQRALEEDAIARPERSPRANVADCVLDIPTGHAPEGEGAVAEPSSPPPRKTLTLVSSPKKDLPKPPEPVSSPESAVTRIDDGRRRVEDGDTILLRFTDGGTGRFIRYTIRGLENDPSKGVIATTDPRAIHLIGKGVDDAIELELPTSCRQATIEKIWREEGRQPLAPEKKTAGKGKQVFDVASRQVEPGDLLLLYYMEGGKRRSRYHRVPSKPDMAQLISPAPPDGPVENLLGKGVGDEFVVRVGSADRLVKIHRIMR